MDAGAQGFVELIAGMTEYIASGSEDEPAVAVPEALASRRRRRRRPGRRRTSRTATAPSAWWPASDVDRRHLREQLSALGGSLVVAGLQSKVRVHIHVNDPAEVFRVAARFGTVSGEKADDMQRQQHSAHARGSPGRDRDRLGRRHPRGRDGPARHPHGAGARALRRPQLPRQGRHHAEEFFAELERNPVHPKTSQPPPGDFRRQFEFLGLAFRLGRVDQHHAPGERHLRRRRGGRRRGSARTAR